MEPIVDAHHHIWRQADQPWLQGPTVPRIFGAYDAIKRDYPVEEFLSDLAGTGVVKSVYVQTNWAKERAVEEVEWVQSVADRAGWPHAIVSFVDLQSEDAPRVMAAQAKSQADARRAPAIALARQSAISLRAGAGPDEHGGVPPQFRAAAGARLAVRASGVRLADGGRRSAGESVSGHHFVLAHAGMPEDRSPSGRRHWREGMRRLADCPNMHTKFSGLGTFIRRNDAGHIAEIVGETLDLFGAQRCVWGSNFPIEKLWTDYAAIVTAFKAAIAHRPDAERRALLYDNAARLYRLS